MYMPDGVYVADRAFIAIWYSVSRWSFPSSERLLLGRGYMGLPATLRIARINYSDQETLRLDLHDGNLASCIELALLVAMVLRHTDLQLAVLL